MSPNSVSKPSTPVASANGASEPTREYNGGEKEGHYADIYSEDRPPHLINANFSSTQPGGSSTQPRQFNSMSNAMNHEHVTNNTGANSRYAASLSNTDSTLKAGDPYARRPDLDYFLNRDYQSANAQPLLTTQAIAALNYHNDTELYDGNISHWCRGLGRTGSISADQANWSTSHLVPNGPRSHSSTTFTWGVVDPDVDQHTAEAVLEAGRWSDIPTDPTTTRATNIRDEDFLNP
ncbi:hypothetical protein GGS26DRAFT_226940 [Hypomontagnella submonticulosa]|nr:hypothetical protein GGS26DRAFT_226940 [Hypomontagnella submonticulosa]